MERKCNQNGAKKEPKWRQNEFKMKTKGAQNDGTKIEPKRCQNEHKMELKWIQNVANMEPIGNKNDKILIDF